MRQSETGKRARSRSSSLTLCLNLCFFFLLLFAFLILLPIASAQTTNLFTFDSGSLPSGSSFSGNNPGSGVTNAGGCLNSGCLVLTRPASGQTYGHWDITNDLAGGLPVSSFFVAFKLYVGHGSGGNGGVPNAGGNGFVFHLGPTPPSQYAGSASTWGNGLDVTFRTYNSSPNTPGINVAYDPVSGSFNPGGGTIIATSSFLGFFQTNGPSDNFSEAVDVSLTLTNGLLSVRCSNLLIGNAIVYTNLAIPSFVPISPGLISFAASDGAGAHEDAWIDNVSIVLNSLQPTGAVVFATQPANQTSRPDEPVIFTAAASGDLPIGYQWFSNNVPIFGAISDNYTTPPVSLSMSGSVYSVTASNSFGSVSSASALLRVLPAVGRTIVWNDDFGGATIDTNKWIQLGDYSRQQGYWLKQDSYLNGQGQLVLRVMQDQPTGHYGAGALQGKYLRTFGYFEAKVKFPTQQGHWCAFWIMTDSQGRIGNGGVDGCEIDIMEKAWLTDHIQHALHWDGYGANSGSAGQQVRNLGLNDGGWHIFSMDWTPTNYIFYVDGQETYRTNAGGVSQVASYIMLTEEIGNFGTGPDAWGTGPITNAALPDYYLVDYVRVYDSIMLLPRLTNGAFSFLLSGGAGLTFAIQATTNLSNSNWATLDILTNTTGTIPFTDTNAAAPFRAYRAKTLP